QRLCLFATILLTLCCLFSCAPAVQSPAPAGKLTIIGTGDLQGRLDADPRSISITESSEKIEIVGGISRIAGLIRQIQRETPNPVIVVSSGDDLMGRYFHQFDGKAIFSLMEMSGYEVMALGNHEFDRGPGVLAEALDSVNFTVLCSNLEVQDTVMGKSCRSYLLLDYQGIRIGFFSLMTNDFPVVTVTGKVKIRNTQAEVARNMIRTLKGKGAQVIVAVTHIGTYMDRILVAEVAGIDIIFGGHSHNYMNRLERVNNTLIVNGGEKGSALVRLDISLDEKNQVIPTSAAYSLIPVTEDIELDAKVEKLLAEYRNQLPAATVVGMTEKEWDLTRVTLCSCESNVANLITDMIRSQFKVDVVLYNGGAFRGNSKFSPGPVTDTMLAEIDAFENNVYLMTMQGKYIRQILEHSATLIGQGGFLQGSGITFTIDTKEQPQKLTHKDRTNYAISRPGKKIKNIRIQSPDGSWQPLDPKRNYRLASNDFLVKLAGDHYFWFKKYGQGIHNTYSTMGTIITDYFRKHTIVNPEGPDGRITIR
ncbi:MAG: 5'-nucleotidase C-terminal domain-containing protein, partial [Thermodesulfobacteriota bacterium]|nr:5'-nucleotidase C-terminal domain-containing protein [Thermodesulfobacteriota bacterium]